MMRRLRPNIIALSAAAAIVTGVAIIGVALVPTLGHDNEHAAIAAIVGLATTANAGLMTLAGRIAEDPPPPAYPANELPALIAAIREAAAAQPPPEARHDDA